MACTLHQIYYGHSFDWLGTIASVLFGFLLKAGYDEVRNVYNKFDGECKIKGELEDIAHDLQVAGRPNEKINAPYGAGFIRHHPQRLFGEHNREVLGYYTDIFDPYNSSLESGTFEENSMRQRTMIDRVEKGILDTPWLKKIPSGPSIKGFIKYLRKQDAESTYVPVRI